MSRHLIVIGASAGGLAVVTRILADLPRDFASPIFIAIHTSADVPGRLSKIFERVGPLPADYAIDRQPIVPGRIVIAPPDRHLLIERGRVRVTHGPRENGFRPAIDPLFRTAAVPADGIGAALVRLTSLRPLSSLPAPDKSPDPAEVGTDQLSVDEVPQGTPSSFTCPECGGVLRETEESGLSTFRCHVGHAYSIEALARGQAEALERALWTALRSLEESAALRRSMAEKARRRGTSDTLSNWMDEQAAEREARAAIVRRALVTDKETGETGSAAAVADRARRAEEKWR